MESRPHARASFRTALLVLLAAVALSIIFWWPLWAGGGLIGGDTFTYFFPQKTFYADRLTQGELPLWNNLAGHGYPLVAESQTGFCYPTTYPLYKLLSVNTAYNTNLLLHYVLCFVFAWMYARRIDLSPMAATLAATVFTYGWFPAKIHWEWSIVEGAWFPLAFWSVESFLRTNRFRYLPLLSLTLAIQLLAGHFNIGFITQVSLAVYVLLRVWWRGAAANAAVPQRERSRVRTCGVLLAAAAFAYSLAAIQLVPTWELKQQSQRGELPLKYVGYGYIPAGYLLQLVAPWYFYAPGVDVNDWRYAGDQGTNKIDAHLYVGLVPIALLIWGLASRQFRGKREQAIWIALGALALVVTTGVLVPITQHLPGFGYFEGPGRYGIVFSLAAAVVAAAAFERLRDRQRGSTRLLLTLLVFTATIGDLYAVSRFNTIATILPEPIIEWRFDSEVRAELADYPGPVRVFAQGQNLVSSLGVSVTPCYLGLSPIQYVDPETKMPEPVSFDGKLTVEQIDWLRRAGVTHLLTSQEVDVDEIPVEFVAVVYDRLLRVAWATQDPISIYRLKQSRGRVAWQQPHNGGTAEVVDYQANSVKVKASSPRGGRLILTDLTYPGWQVLVDGEPVPSVTVENMYRAVDLASGQHTVVWEYRPTSLFIGMAVSGVSLVLLGLIACVVHKRRLVGQLSRGTAPLAGGE